MSTYKTTVNGKPATVEITKDGSVKVVGDGHTWEFTPDLKPKSVLIDGTQSPTTFRLEGGTAYKALNGSEHDACALPVGLDDPHLRSFVAALNAVNDVSYQPSFPERVAEKLPAAYETLGIDAMGRLF